MRLFGRASSNLHGEDNEAEPDFVFDTSANSRAYSSNEGTVRTARRSFVSYAPVSKGHIASGGSNSLFETALTEPCSGFHRYAPLCGRGNSPHRALSVGYSFGIPLLVNICVTIFHPEHMGIHDILCSTVAIDTSFYDPTKLREKDKFVISYETQKEEEKKDE